MFPLKPIETFLLLLLLSFSVHLVIIATPSLGNRRPSLTASGEHFALHSATTHDAEEAEVYVPSISLCPYLPPRLDPPEQPVIRLPLNTDRLDLSFTSSIESDRNRRRNPKARPTSINDLRPDDFDVIVALGDSITAGLMAERAMTMPNSGPSSRFDELNRQHPYIRPAREDQLDGEAPNEFLPQIRERRGVSYATGGDPDSISLGGLIAFYRAAQGRVPGSVRSGWAGGKVEDSGDDSDRGVLDDDPGRYQHEPARREVTQSPLRIIINPTPTSPFPLWPGSPPHDRSADPLIGLSYLSHSPSTLISHTPAHDGLNAALSGSTVHGLMAQVKGYVRSGLQELGVDLVAEKREREMGQQGRRWWKLMTINIGANDLCSFCLSTNITSSPASHGTEKDLKSRSSGSSSSSPGSAVAFAQTMREVLEEVREEIPNTLVEIIGLFRVSSIYNLSLQNPHCTPLHLPPLFPQLPLECSCATVPGPLGDATRAKMDALGEEYDEAVRGVVKEMMAEQRAKGKAGEGFGVVWQPGTILDLSSYPSIPSLSPIDCFHPSQESHAHIAAGLWNTLTADEQGRRTKIPWWTDGKEGGDDDGGKRDMRPLLRCLRPEDRIRL